MTTLCSETSLRPAQSWLGRLLIGFAVSANLIIAAYFFVDLPVLFFFNSIDLDRYQALKWLTRPPEAFVLLSPVVLLFNVVKRQFRPWTRLERLLTAASVSTLLAALAVGLLKVAFGRYNPDLVLTADRLYGFNPFTLHPHCRALPSGHIACTVSASAVAAFVCPRWRLCCWAMAGMVACMLVALNHHYVGDIVAGVFVGWASAGTVVRALALRPIHPENGIPASPFTPSPLPPTSTANASTPA